MLQLSKREREVLDLYTQGRSYKQIAGELGISMDTVKTYAQRIIVKNLAESLHHAAWLHRQHSDLHLIVRSCQTS